MLDDAVEESILAASKTPGQDRYVNSSRVLEFEEAPVLLVVDDEESVRGQVRRFFEQRGVSVVTCRSGVEAVLRAKDLHVAVVLLDAAIQNFDGAETCRMLRAHGYLNDIIIFSGAGTQAVVDVFLAGADSYIAKGGPFEVLEAAVWASLRHAQRGQAVVPPTRLTVTQHRIFTALSAARGAWVPLSTLARAAWPNTTVSPKTVRSHVSTLRKRLGREGDRIESSRGRGYRLGKWAG